MRHVVLLAGLLCCCLLVPATARTEVTDIYDPGRLAPTDSRIKVETGQTAPDFALPGFGGKTVRLSDYRGRSNVIISFVPAAFTPVCSAQWPGYNLAEELIRAHNTVVLGISTDNIPSLYAWTRQMGGVWFPVLSDFYPHGKAASAYGLLRSDGTAERTEIIIDTNGVIRDIKVHDINAKPDLERLIKALDKLN
jgi:peroxiredoxin